METQFDIIRRHKKDAPVDVFQLAEDLGISVYLKPLPEAVSGKLTRDEWGYEIHVNQRHGSNRQRFTIAHEIAHYILHSDLFEGEIVDDAMYRSEQISGEYETQANSYAAELLMPKALIATRYRELLENRLNHETITYHMAENFQVSEEAMRIRLSTNPHIEFSVA